MRSVRVIAAVLIALVCASVLPLSLMAEEAVPHGVEDQVERALDRGDLRFRRPALPRCEPGEPLEDFEIEGTGERVWREKASGAVRRYMNPKALEKSQGEALGEGNLLSIADSAAGRILGTARVAGMKRSSQLRDDGLHQTCVVTYREYVSGIPTFNEVILEYTRGGRLIGYTTQDDVIEVSLEPSISRVKATAIAAEANDLPRWSGESASLTLLRVATGEQRLCWEVELRTGDEQFGSSSMAIVDAHSGEVVGCSY